MSTVSPVTDMEVSTSIRSSLQAPTFTACKVTATSYCHIQATPAHMRMANSNCVDTFAAAVPVDCRYWRHSRLCRSRGHRRQRRG
eukprot:6177539-Pleurochrysis_carterae.AAC.2